MEWFFDTFFEINMFLYDCLSDGAKLNQDLLKHLVQSALDCFTEIEYQDRHRHFTRLAIGHYEMNMKAFQVPLLANVMMKAFDKCLDKEMYNQLKDSLARILSSMMRGVLPPLLFCEKRGAESLMKDFKHDDVSTLFSE